MAIAAIIYLPNHGTVASHVVYCLIILTVCIGTDRPTIKLFNKYVRNNIASKWEDLGVQLLDEEHHSMLNNIAENKPDVQGRCTELFEYWLTVDINASWNKLIKALKEMNQNTLVEKIKRKILSEPQRTISEVDDNDQHDSQLEEYDDDHSSEDEGRQNI